MVNKIKKLVSRPKSGNLRIASTAPWMEAKTDTPTQEKQPSAANLKQSVDDFRWEKHLENKNKTDEQRQKEYTEKQTQAANNTRTWRSDVADILHGLGEAAFASNPYTAVSYFGAKALDGALSNAQAQMDNKQNITFGKTITPEVIANAGFAALPWMHVLAPMIQSGVQKGAQFMTSNITGKWTPFFGREYRLNPNIVGVNGGGIQSRPIGTNGSTYRNVDDMLQREALEMDSGLLYNGGNNAASVTGTTPENLLNIVQQHPNTVIVHPRMGGRFSIEESTPNAFREILLENEEQLANKGLLPRRVRVGQPTETNSQSVLTPQQQETLRRIPDRSVISANSSRIVDIPREELAKKGVGLDMSEGGIPYQESDIFLSNGEAKPGIDLRTFHTSKPGRNNVAYWFPKSPEFKKLADEEQARQRVSTYFGATLNRQALVDELNRISLSNPTNVSGTYGYLGNFDVNPNSFKSLMGNLRRQVQSGRNIRLLKRPTEESEYLLPNNLHQAGRYIEEVDPELKQIFRNHYDQFEKQASENFMKNLFGSDEAILGASGIPESTGKLSSQQFNMKLQNYLNQKANYRERFLTPDNLSFAKTPEGYKISLGNRDLGLLRFNSLENQYDDLINHFNKNVGKTKLEIPAPRIITNEDLLRNPQLLDDSEGLDPYRKFKLIGIPNITTFTLKKGGKLNVKKLIKRRK